MCFLSADKIKCWFHWKHGKAEFYFKLDIYRIYGCSMSISEYLRILQNIPQYLKISYYIYFFLRTYSTFGFSWMHSSIQDTWYDKCCSFDVQGANEWPEWQTKLLAHFNDWTDRLVQCLPSRSGSDSSAALHCGRRVAWENYNFAVFFHIVWKWKWMAKKASGPL